MPRGRLKKINKQSIKHIMMSIFLKIKLIRELEKQPKVSQRQLSIRCNVSMDSINYCLSAVIEKGFVKEKNFKNSKNKLPYSYILRPSGLTHKQKITRDFLKKKKLEFELNKNELSKLTGELNQMSQKI